MIGRIRNMICSYVLSFVTDDTVLYGLVRYGMRSAVSIGMIIGTVGLCYDALTDFRVDCTVNYPPLVSIPIY